jgi:hypothetical protein
MKPAIDHRITVDENNGAGILVHGSAFLAVESARIYRRNAGLGIRSVGAAESQPKGRELGNWELARTGRTPLPRILLARKTNAADIVSRQPGNPQKNNRGF